MANIQVSWAEFVIPSPTLGVSTGPITRGRCQQHCACNCPCNCPPQPPGPPHCGRHPVRYSTGEVVLSATDIAAAGFGTSWGHTRSFASGLSTDTNVGNGANWQIEQWCYLMIQDTTVAVMGQATEVIWFFLQDDGTYAPSFDNRESLVLDPVNNVFLLTDLHGNVTTYSASSGVFQSYVDAAGNKVQVVSYTSNGFNFSEVQRTFTSSGVTTVESYLYTWVDSTVPSPFLSSVLLRRQVGGGSWTNVTQVLYTYYSDGSAFGNSGDLETVNTQNWNGSAWESTGTTLYRYTVCGGSSSSSSSSSSSPSSSSSSSSSLVSSSSSSSSSSSTPSSSSK